MTTLLIKPDEGTIDTLYDYAVVRLTPELWTTLQRRRLTLLALQADDNALHSMVFEADSRDCAGFVMLSDRNPWRWSAFLDELSAAFDEASVLRREAPDDSPDDTYRDRIEVSVDGVRWTGIHDVTEDQLGTLVVPWSELDAALAGEPPAGEPPTDPS